MGRLTQESSSEYQAASRSQYDLAGRRTRMTWRDGNYVDYVYDTLGEMTEIRENGATSPPGLLAVFAYDDRGRRTRLTRGNGLATTYAYDDVDELTQLVQNLNGTASDLTLGFGYNPAGQIVSNTRSNDAYSFAQSNANVADTVNGLNQVTAAGGSSISHDGRGNVSAIPGSGSGTGGSASYAYTQEDRLATAPGGSFYYDPLGRLMYATSATTLFDNDGASASLERNDRTSATRRRWVYGPDGEPLVWYEGSGRIWIAVTMH